jgi:hypothetical protein
MSTTAGPALFQIWLTERSPLVVETGLALTTVVVEAVAEEDWPSVEYPPAPAPAPITRAAPMPASVRLRVECMFRFLSQFGALLGHCTAVA